MAMTASEARRNLSGLIERVNLDRVEIEIVSRGRSAVLISKDEYEALKETGYVLSSPANATRLLASLKSALDTSA
jgi:antitoxin YefM